VKPILTVGVLLIVLGVVALAYQGFTYKTRETVLDIGPLHATAEKQHNVPLPPVLGIVAVVAGVVMVIAGGRQRA
jgi:uncharacterized membrane protein